MNARVIETTILGRPIAIHERNFTLGLGEEAIIEILYVDRDTGELYADIQQSSGGCVVQAIGHRAPFPTLTEAVTEALGLIRANIAATYSTR